jgi:hypothetical protein
LGEITALISAMAAVAGILLGIFGVPPFHGASNPRPRTDARSPATASANPSTAPTPSTTSTASATSATPSAPPALPQGWRRVTEQDAVWLDLDYHWRGQTAPRKRVEVFVAGDAGRVYQLLVDTTAGGDRLTRQRELFETARAQLVTDIE